MINVSNAFREKLEAGEPVRMVVDITFPDGTKKTINKDIMNGDNGFPTVQIAAVFQSALLSVKR